MSDPTPQPTPSTPQERFDQALAELPAKQRRFVTEYLRDLNGTQAAIRAGYSERSARSEASRMLTFVNIRAAVDAGMDLQAMGAGEILARLSMQARGDMSDFLRVDEEEITLSTRVAVLTPEEEAGVVADATGLLRNLIPDDGKERRAVTITTATITRSVARLDLLEAGRRGKLATVKKYTWDPENGKVSVELYSAKDALELLGKYRKLWGDDGAGGIMKYLDVSKLTPDQLERLSAGEDPYAVLLGR